MLPHVNVLMLLDRRADVHLARRSAAEGWLIKPLDPLSIKRAATQILSRPPVPVDEPDDDQVTADDIAAEEEPATAG
jgi:hypothetical protein